ncbi:hypothetical protein ACJU26_03580 [Acidithiobacillus sp. M4-SHS-6]|uniref:hypothetical protein n=1 Tax=Acidithiobacillus sp. M4-SHS-6 TaxID=3383024 RepID=UPI0039BEA852
MSVRYSIREASTRRLIGPCRVFHPSSGQHWPLPCTGIAGGTLEQRQMDQKAAGEAARKKLQEATELLRQAGCQKIGDLALDLAACAAHAGEGEVLAQPYNLPLDRVQTPEAWRQMRLYPAVFPACDVNSLMAARPAGRARHDPESAIVGSAVRRLLPFFRDHDERDSIIADLLAEVDIDTTRQNVRRIVTGYSIKIRPRLLHTS